MEDSNYFSRSWKLMTKEKGWIKPILLMALGCFVPIVGPIAVFGYACEWARLSAWGVDASPKQKGVKLGKCLSSGWRAGVACFVWAIVLGVVAGILNAILGFILGSLGEMLVSVASFVVSPVIMAAGIHAVIYEKISAGLKVRRIIEMVKRDWQGLLKTVLIPLCVALIAGALGVVVMLSVLGFALPDIMQLVYLVEYSSSNYMIGSLVASILRGVLPAMVVFIYVDLVLGSAGSLLFTNSVGLWMRQFDVPAWGGPDEPLPAQGNALPPVDNVPPAAPASTSEPEAVAPASVPEPIVTEPVKQPEVQVIPTEVPAPAPASTEPAAREITEPATDGEGETASEERPAELDAVLAPAPEPAKTIEVPAAGSEEAEQLQDDSGETIVPLVRPRNEEDSE